jgi:oligoendopeptidase F
MISTKERKYIPAQLEINWENLEPLFKELTERQINSVSDLEIWLRDRSELEAALEEDFAIPPTRNCFKTSNILQLR